MTARLPLAKTSAASTQEGNKAVASPQMARSPENSFGSAPGRKLDSTTRAFFEPRFGHDFSKIRIHTDSIGLAEATSRNARASASSGQISFAPGEFQPGTESGRRLLGHELAHIVQQTKAGPKASTEDLEQEASRAGEMVTMGGQAQIHLSAAADAPLFQTRTVGGRTFQVGDVKLNQGAAVDVRKNGVLLPGPDQAHILVTSDSRLGYESAYTTPDDPFRFSHLKDIVDSGSLDIFAVSPTTSFNVKEVTSAGEQIVQRSLAGISFGAGAITLPRLSAQRAINPTGKAFVASAIDSRDQIYYDSSGGNGRGVLGSNSLAHEFFGHLWLSRKGVPWQHGSQINATSGVLDPQGRPYQGSVDDYISHYAGESHTALQSPTQGVSPTLQEQTISWLMTKGAAGLTSLPNGKFSVSPEFGAKWERLSGEYSVVKFQHASDTEPATATATSVSTAAGIRSRVVTWYKSLNSDKQSVFKSFIQTLTAGWTAPQNRRDELPADIKPLL